MKHLQAVRRRRARKPTAEKNDLKHAAAPAGGGRLRVRRTGLRSARRARKSASEPASTPPPSTISLAGIENLYLAVLEEIRKSNWPPPTLSCSDRRRNRAKNKTQSNLRRSSWCHLTLSSFRVDGADHWPGTHTPSGASEALWKNARARIALFKHEIAKDLGLPRITHGRARVCQVSWRPCTGFYCRPALIKAYLPESRIQARTTLTR